MKVKCKICQTYKECKPYFLQKRLEIYTNIATLNKNYICKFCQRQVSNMVEQSDLLKKELKKFIKTFDKTNMYIKENQQAFLDGVKQIMLKNYIEHYQFVVDNNKIQSILIKNIPFIKTMEIKL